MHFYPFQHHADASYNSCIATFAAATSSHSHSHSDSDSDSKADAHDVTPEPETFELAAEEEFVFTKLAILNLSPSFRFAGN